MNIILDYPILTVVTIFLLIFIGYPFFKRLTHKPTPPPKADPNRPSTSTRCWGIDKKTNENGVFEKYVVTYEEGYNSGIYEVWNEYHTSKHGVYIEIKCKEIKTFDFKTHEEAQAVCDILNKDPFYYHTPEDKAFFQVHGFYKLNIPF